MRTRLRELLSITTVLFIMSAKSKTSTSSDQPPPAKRAKLKTDSRADAATATYVSNPCGLDANLWANIASGLEFGEMIRFSSTCKAFYKDAAPLIEKIEVTSPAHMHVIPARRFRGVKTAIVACLVNEIKFFSEAASRFVSFITAFPLLTYAMIGGCHSERWVDEKVEPYIWWRDLFDDDHAHDHHRYLNGQLSAVCGAYRSGLLQSTLTIDGLFSGNCGADDRLAIRPCRFCLTVCQSLPVQKVTSLLPRRIPLEENKIRYHDEQHDICIDMTHIVAGLAQRPGALDLILSPSFLLSFICRKSAFLREDYEEERKMGFLMSLKKQDESISFGKIIKRGHIEEYFRSLRQQKKELHIAGFFLEYLQDEGLPFRKDDFDKVFNASLNHKSKYDL